MVSSEGRNNRETKSGIARKMAAGLEKKVVRKAKNLDWQIFPQPVEAVWCEHVVDFLGLLELQARYFAVSLNHVEGT